MALSDSLAAHWQFNETAGNRFDGVSGNTLTNVGGVRVDGKVGYGVSLSGSAQYLSRLSSASLSMGDATDGWWAWAWVNFAALPTSDQHMGILSKQDASLGSEWWVSMNNNSGALYQLYFTAVPASGAAVVVTNTVTLAVNEWHLVEIWQDRVANTVNVAWDGGAPGTAALTGALRAVGTDFYVGAQYNVAGLLNGKINTPTVRKLAPTAAERTALWNGGAGVSPLPAHSTGSVTAAIDNSGGVAPIAAGTPINLWLPPSFDWANVHYANGDDLKVAGRALWPEIVDKGNTYGKVWVASPAVAAGATAEVTMTYGGTTHFASADYSTLFTKRVADAGTLALFPCDSIAAAATASTVGGFSMALTGTPTEEATDGGNFRARVPVQSFATGKHLTLNGTSQRASVSTLLDTPPAAGYVAGWFKINSTPAAGARVFSKVNNFTGAVVDDGIELLFTSSGTIAARITKAGVAVDAIHETLSSFPLNLWVHVVVSWGSKLQFWINGCKFAEGTLTGTWDAGSESAFSVGAKLLGATASDFCPVSFDEVEVGNVEPSRSTILGWFDRGGRPNTYEHDRWVPNPSEPIITATLPGEGPAIGECRIVRTGASSYVGAYSTGGFASSYLAGFTSTNGKTISKTGAIMGLGTGGESLNACRTNIFKDDDGTLYLYWSQAIGVVGGNVYWATTTDGGLTWTKQGTVIAPDAGHTGWANMTVARAGATYYWMIEYSGGVTQYRNAHLRSSSPTGPLTLIDDDLPALTLQQGVGAFSTGKLLYIDGLFHFFPHAAKFNSLPSAIYHFVSPDCLHWEPRGGGDPVVDLAHFGYEPRQDQAADAYVYAIPESGEVAIINTHGNNSGGGIVATVNQSLFTGTLSDLGVEYPRVVLGTPVVAVPPYEAGSVLGYGGSSLMITP